ncbi:MAG: magnesium transporter [Lachnospiraceae bacterium]|nr:magnesium transporter [Lachnospiraceae bacterium]
MTEQNITFIEDTGDVKRWLDKQVEKIQNVQSPDHFLLQLLEQMVESDVLYLSHFEKEMENMEDTLLHGIPKDFYPSLTRMRQKLSELNAYYEQLTAIGDLIQAYDESLLIKNTEQWGRYVLRIERLQNHVHLLRENILQLRELYQSQQDAQQNKIMCILTVVTTLFLPLTLLTGWYGMNFAYMPELQWKYGYPAVIIVAIVIVAIEIMYFKKKKLF